MMIEPQNMCGFCMYENKMPSNQLERVENVICDDCGREGSAFHISQDGLDRQAAVRDKWGSGMYLAELVSEAQS